MGAIYHGRPLPHLHLALLRLITKGTTEKVKGKRRGSVASSLSFVVARSNSCLLLTTPIMLRIKKNCRLILCDISHHLGSKEGRRLPRAGRRHKKACGGSPTRAFLSGLTNQSVINGRCGDFISSLWVAFHSSGDISPRI